MFSFRPVVLRVLRHFNDLRHFAGHKWRVALTLADGFRIAWVGTLSVVAAMVLLVYLPQGKDLFLDVRGSRGIGALFWIGFYMGVIFIWLLPVYLSSCWILKCYPAGGPHGDRELASWVRDTVPRVLVVMGLVTILAGQVSSVMEAPYILDSGNNERDPKNEILYILAFITAVFLLYSFKAWLYERFSSFDDMRAWRINTRGLLMTFVLFAAVLIVGARINNFGSSAGEILNKLYEFLREFSKNYMPSNIDLTLAATLGLALLALPIGYVLSFIPFRLFKWLAALLLLFSAVMVLVPSIAFVAWFAIEELRARLFKLAAFESAAPLGIGHLALLPPISLLLTHIAWLHLRPARDVPVLALAPDHNPQSESAFQSLRENLDWPFAWALLISISIIVVHVCFSPVVVTEYVYRALLVPFLLGLLVPILTFFCFWSFRWHIPFVLTSVIVLGYLAPDTDAVRTTKKGADRPTLEETVERWKAVNDCEASATDPARKCPSPIIIAAAGGASRSAFLVGSVIGKLLDQKVSSKEEPLRPFDQQLFAISGVSGGALGAAVTYAALADSVRAKGVSRDLGNPPCKHDARAIDSEWFAPHLKPSTNPDKSWHECLQLILSGDFLSPVMASLISGEFAGFAPFGDRAAVLESAWEQRYDHLTQQMPYAAGEQMTMASSLTGLRQRGLEAGPKAWLPMLLLTGTSVSTGRRILTSDVDTLLSRKLNNLRGRLFHDAYDLHELISPTLRVRDALFSPDGKSILLWYIDDTKIRILDVETGKTRQQFEAGPQLTMEALWSPDGQYVLSWTSGEAAKLWRVSTGEVVTTFDDMSLLPRPVFAEDSRTLLIAFEKKVVLWDLAAGRELRPIDLKNLNAATIVQNSRVLLTRAGETVVLSDLASGQQIGQFEANSLNITEDGLAALACQRNKSASILYDTGNGNVLSRINDIGCQGLMRLSSDRRQLLVVGPSITARPAQVYNLDTGEKFFDTGLENRLAAFSPDGQRLLYAPIGKPIAIRFLQSGVEREVPGTAGIWRGNVAISPDGRFALTWQESSASSGARVTVIDMAAGLVMREIRGQEGWVEGAIIHPDNGTVFAWSDNGIIRLWNLVTGEEKFVVRGAVSAAGCQQCDIRLSTAVTMSARFPIISPHGTLHQNGEISDRVVDGGYFENFGALTAAELADELRGPPFNLDPRIILINNEPSAAGMSCLAEDSQLGMPVPEQRITFSTFRSPIEAMWATRSARGTHAAVDLCARVKGRENFAFITVKQDGRFAGAELPMSWWLSKHAQQYLDAQIDTKASDSNDKAFSNIEAWRKIQVLP